MKVEWDLTAPLLDLDAQQVYVADVLQAYNGPMLQALTGYAYLVDAINELGP